jgi:phage-related minor tail protein
VNVGELQATLGLDDSPFEQSMGEAGSKGADKLKGALAAAGIGLSVAEALTEGLDLGAANDRLASQLGATGEFAGELGKVAGDLYTQNYGDSLEGVQAALKDVWQQGLLPEDATNEQIERITGKALNMASVFEQDSAAIAASVKSMLVNGIAGSADEAFDILTRGFQQGTDKAGDLLDTFTEYSPQFAQLGLDATTAMGLLSQGLKGGARDADTVADGLKEFALIAASGSATAADGFKRLGLNAKDMTAAVAAGGPGAAAALGTVLEKLRGIKDPAEQSQIAVELFGTKAEDLQNSLLALDPSTAVDAMGNVAGAADQMGETLAGNTKNSLEVFKREALMTIATTMNEQVIPAITNLITAGIQLGGWVSEHTPVLAGLGAVILAFLVPAFIGWATSASAAAIATVVAAAPVIALAAILGLLVGAVVWAYQNVDWFRASVDAVASFLTGTVVPAFGSLWGIIMAVFGWLLAHWPLVLGVLVGPIGIAVALIATHWGTIKSGATAVKDWIVEKFNSMVSFFSGLPGRMGGAVSGLWDGIKNGFRDAINAVIDWWNNLSFPSYTFPKISTPIGDIGGNTVGGWSLPDVGRLHSGGLVTGVPGTEVLRILEAGEVVLSRRQVAAIGAGGVLGGGTSMTGVVDELRALRGDVARMRAVNVHTGPLTDREAARIGAKAGAMLAMAGGY